MNTYMDARECANRIYDRFQAIRYVQGGPEIWLFSVSLSAHARVVESRSLFNPLGRIFVCSDPSEDPPPEGGPSLRECTSLQYALRRVAVSLVDDAWRSREDIREFQNKAIFRIMDVTLALVLEKAIEKGHFAVGTHLKVI